MDNIDDRFISVEDSLPENGSKVLIKYYNPYLNLWSYTVDVYNPEHGGFVESYIRDRTVSHWMPVLESEKMGRTYNE